MLSIVVSSFSPKMDCRLPSKGSYVENTNRRERVGESETHRSPRDVTRPRLTPCRPVPLIYGDRFEKWLTFKMFAVCTRCTSVIAGVHKRSATFALYDVSYIVVESKVKVCVCFYANGDFFVQVNSFSRGVFPQRPCRQAVSSRTPLPSPALPFTHPGICLVVIIF